MRNRLLSFKYAFRGILVTIRTQPNAKIHLGAALLVVGSGLYFQITSMEWCLLILCIGVVLAAEAMNTAIESTIDLVSPEIHPLAGRAKDTAAGAVLLSALTAAVVGLFIFWPYLTK